MVETSGNRRQHYPEKLYSDNVSTAPDSGIDCPEVTISPILQPYDNCNPP